jgi:hypothetical protein
MVVPRYFNKTILFVSFNPTCGCMVPSSICQSVPPACPLIVFRKRNETLFAYLMMRVKAVRTWTFFIRKGEVEEVVGS